MMTSQVCTLLTEIYRSPYTFCIFNCNNEVKKLTETPSFSPFFRTELWARQMLLRAKILDFWDLKFRTVNT